MKSLTKALFGLVTIFMLAANSGSVYAAIAGHVQFVQGKVHLTAMTGVTHEIKKGDAVNEGDTLISAPTASAQIRMEDGGIVAMRSDSKLKIERFTFNGQQDGTERSLISLFKGGFRAITGLIGKVNKANYQITTPATTIGIRGTDHEIFIVTPDSALASGTPIGTYNKVNTGETSMTTEKGTVFVLPNQMGFAGATDQMPQLQPVNLNIFTVTAQPALHTSNDKRDEKKGQDQNARETAREAAKVDKTEIRETARGDKIEMRDTVKADKVEMRENEAVGKIEIQDADKVEKIEMRDTVTVDKIEIYNTPQVDKIEMHATPIMETTRAVDPAVFTSPTEDAVKGPIPPTPQGVLEQPQSLPGSPVSK